MALTLKLYTRQVYIGSVDDFELVYMYGLLTQENAPTSHFQGYITRGYRKNDNTNLNKRAQWDHLHNHQWDERGTHRLIINHCSLGEST